MAPPDSMPLDVQARIESWPIAPGFRISRGARTDAVVVVLEITTPDGVTGRAECVPYARYGESPKAVRQAILGAINPGERCPTRAEIQRRMAPGAARNALDCALWDLEAQRQGKSAWMLADLGTEPPEAKTMRTVSVASPGTMAEAAGLFADATVLKVKVDGGADLARIEAVHRSAPNAALVVDPNESWTESQLEAWLPELPQYGVVTVEQPLPSAADACLERFRGVVPFCADESFHDRRSFDAIAGRYDIVNLKLDKTGGLTEAIGCFAEATARGLGVMIGCMVSTTLAIAPALGLATRANFVDLDGPLLLARDRPEARHDASTNLLRSAPDLWGGQPPRSARSRA